MRKILLARFPIKIAILIYLKMVSSKLKRIIKGVIGKKKIVKRKRKRKSISIEEISAVLTELGLNKGDVVLVHSGISNLGKVNKGAIGVFELLKDRVGKDGCVLFPAFSFKGPMEGYLEGNPAISLDDDITTMGALSKKALSDSDCVRSVHPTHSVACIGDKCEKIISNHFDSVTSFDENSPFYKLIEEKGKILLIGVDLNSVTNFHVPESQMKDKYPLDVNLDEKYCISVTYKNNVKNVITKVLDSRLSLIRDCNRLHDELDRDGILNKVRIGSGFITLIDAFAFNEKVKELALKGVTIYGNV